jgi:CBS domain-containing protein
MRTSVRLSTLLEQKGHRVWSIEPEASVFLAIAAMSQYEVGSLLVMEGQRLLGIVSERDYTRKVILQGRSSKQAAVSEIMAEPVTISQDDTVEDAMRLMTERRVRHLPVIDGTGHVAGIVSIGDVVKWIISEQREQIQYLEQMIVGSYPV